MADDRIEGAQATANAGSAPRIQDHKSVARALSDEPIARAAAEWAAEQDVIRSIYAARMVAAPSEVAGSFEGVDTTGNSGGVLRGAYLKHLFQVRTETVRGADLSSGNAVRNAYVARAVEAPTVRGGQRARSKRATHVKAGAASRAKPSAQRKAKAASGNRAVKRAKPRLSERSRAGTAARPRRKAKRSRRR